MRFGVVLTLCWSVSGRVLQSSVQVAEPGDTPHRPRTRARGRSPLSGGRVLLPAYINAEQLDLRRLCCGEGETES